MNPVKKQIPKPIQYKYRHPDDDYDFRKRELPNDKIFYNVVTIMRANPLHINHATMLRGLCDRAVNVNINLGSSNKYDKKNPFRIEEREDMMNLALRDYKNYKLFRLPDVPTDDEWFENIRKLNGDFTEILSNNGYDLKVFSEHQYEPGVEKIERNRKYDIVPPIAVMRNEDMLYVTKVKQNGIWQPTKLPIYASGTFVRAAIINNWNWADYLDSKVADYIKKNNLAERLEHFCPELKNINVDALYEGR